MEKAPQPTTGAQSQPQPQPAPPSNPPPAEATPNGAQPAPPAVMVVGVPPQQVPPPAWSTGLFECFDDPTTLIITFFAPCVTFGQVAEMVDQGRTSVGMFAALHFLIMYFTGCGCLLSAYFRIKMSHLYRLPDDPIINILVHLICEPCALCQEYRELQHRGFNMKLGVGWHNQSPEIQQTAGGAIVVPPAVPGGMSRSGIERKIGKGRGGGGAVAGGTSSGRDGGRTDE
ncbi:protein PLANT CADMIUM RESISTANCE 3-like [Cynara cardunculus var. scolymus]|uniref:protein PLANT CADMIUM RESISTANCE 3-like n=1 Tax=Cynara cardunculus var. scolymus TaxID=59895 RepID=UPI000D622F9F|nr:protein PLANT CADMIUM RESISTANCE 3-like [Cynara cardunculus var. scolymus]